MIQYDKDLTQLGSRLTMLNSPLKALSPNSLDLGSVSTFSRYVLLVKLESTFNSEFWKTTVERSDVIGVVVIIPRIPTFEQTSKFQELESTLLSKSISKAVYFAKENESLESVFAQIQHENSLEFFQIVSQEKDATIITPLNLYNFQGTLQSSSKGPSIAIVANYDTISSIPEMSPGYDSNGSGVVAILELARMFSHLYTSSDGTKGKYNIIFLLTSGSRFNYEGTKHWLKKISTDLYESLEFTLCLEALIGKELYLHVSEKSTNKNVIRFYSDMSKTASEMKIPFAITVKKINPGASEVPWEHEVLSWKNKLNAATLSHLKTPRSQFLRASAMEVKPDLKILERNIKFIAESLAKYIYSSNSTNLEVFRSNDIHSQFISSWMSTFESNSRFVPLLKSDSPLLQSLKKTLSQFTNEIIEQEFPVTTNLKFYNPASSTLEIFKVKSIWFDLILLIPVLVFCIGLHVAIVGVSEAISNVKSILKK